MAAEANDGKRKVTLKEIEELYDRLGVSRDPNEPPRSFEEYAWKYGLRPEAKRHGTTLDPHTRLSR
jgi:hypothetical protein